ncbi:MAG: AraC-like DNA-binding protein [Chitinophagales bacterium]|jgi:AraC-like DNA-binding protein
MIRISGSFAQIIRAWMNRHNIENPELSSKLDLIANQETIAQSQWRQLLAHAVSLTPNQAAGIQIGAEVEIQHAGVLGYLVLNSETIADALETYMLCERHFYSLNFAQLYCGEKQWTLAWPDHLGNDNALFVQVAFSALVTFIRHRFPGACSLLAVSFTGDAPDNIIPIEEFFACPVSFNSTKPGITFDASSVHTPLQQQLPIGFQTMRLAQQQAFSKAIKISDPFLLRLQQVLLKLLPEGKATLPHVAVELNSSVRSVQRKLASYNLSYQALLNSVREQLARRYLTRTNLSLAELALLLGYSDQSAFTRSFKGWTDNSPGDFRLKNK